MGRTGGSLEDVLEHYGIKGMKWGVRRGRDVSARHPPSEDYQKVAGKKTVAKTSGTKALSNTELQEVITRMNLEQQYSRLNPKSTPVRNGQAFVKDALALGATVNAVIAFTRSPAGKAMASGFKKRRSKSGPALLALPAGR